MPSYKTHSIHGELILPSMDKKIEINNEDLKTFCIGPDAMMCTGYKIFEYQHENNVKDYFETLLKKIKENKLQDNSEVMAFLYGQLDHYILDVIMHPFICYISKELPNDCLISKHALMELWIDDYVIQKFNKNQKKYYEKRKINDKSLKKIINSVYKDVYNSSNTSLKYEIGYNLVDLFDFLGRSKFIKFSSFIIDKLNIGDIKYHSDLKHIIPHLNLNNNDWYDLETSEKRKDSFDDLWKKSIEIALETIDDVNKYLYQDKVLTNTYILNNISYNTGVPCKVKKLHI